MDEMRAFVARLYDVTVLESQQKYVNFPAPSRAIYPGTFGGDTFYAAQVTYWGENRNTFNAIARRSSFTTGAKAMTKYYGVEPHGFITVGSSEAAALMDAVAQWIDAKCP
ncbi:hypothetical protein [Edaphobacter modestus]|uniref:hypothetical protein n=1 Tax=Edaphobacter modestus TaxID=388466 RepID=UPI0013EEBC8E|nr:hypothetical protein [Edaphobacter modestus]